MSKAKIKNNGYIDWIILIPIIALMLFSLSFVYSASASIAELKFGDAEKLFLSHSIRVGLGIVLIFIFAKVDYHIWEKISIYLMGIGILLLIVVLFSGSSIKGASRWISLGPLSFQPSEFAKFAMVIHFANLLNKKQKFIKEFERSLLPFLIWTGVICLLIALQPNFSTMTVILIIAMSMMFIGNLNLLHLLGVGSVSLLLGLTYMVSAEYRLNRLMAFFGVGDSPAHETVNYQLNQALIALGNGGFFGIGTGQSRQSHFFLPESYGDFIFSIIGEEYGFAGLILVLMVFVIMFWRGMKIAKRAPDNFGYFLSVGILMTFAIYVFVNAGVNVGLLPTTGVPMPFVSYGGTAVFFYSIAIGTLLNISAQAGINPKVQINKRNIETSDTYNNENDGRSVLEEIQKKNT
ncbi:MAG TPA: putative peptidoglycan glycosyltransferase FtsW [Candidatus Kapabacteria bacterium]|nr:putative peptidoglycan glycosyltransferase FtsW [Candidatus Kapabacteria bacterium]